MEKPGRSRAGGNVAPKLTTPSKVCQFLWQDCILTLPQPFSQGGSPMRSFATLCLAALVVLILAACSTPPTATPAPTPDIPATVTAQVQAHLDTMPAATPLPTYTPYPTATALLATPAPTPSHLTRTSPPTPTPEPPYRIDLPAWAIEYFPLAKDVWIGTPPWYLTKTPLKIIDYETIDECAAPGSVPGYCGEVQVEVITERGGYAVPSLSMIVLNPNPELNAWDPKQPTTTFLHEYAHLMDDREPPPADIHDYYFDRIYQGLVAEWTSVEGRLKIYMSGYLAGDVTYLPTHEPKSVPTRTPTPLPTIPWPTPQPPPTVPAQLLDPPFSVVLPPWVSDFFPLLKGLWVGNPPGYPNPRNWDEHGVDSYADKDYGYIVLNPYEYLTVSPTLLNWWFLLPEESTHVTRVFLDDAVTWGYIHLSGADLDLTRTDLELEVCEYIRQLTIEMRVYQSLNDEMIVEEILAHLSEPGKTETYGEEFIRSCFG